jgi:hypothetical protein
LLVVVVVVVRENSPPPPKKHGGGGENQEKQGVKVSHNTDIGSYGERLVMQMLTPIGEVTTESAADLTFEGIPLEVKTRRLQR